jgi:N-acetylneuraminic acid mutarotase
MYVMSGYVGYHGDDASVLKFDSMQNVWSEVAPMPESRSAFAACAVGSDIFVFGGYGAIGAEQASVFSDFSLSRFFTSRFKRKKRGCVFT